MYQRAAIAQSVLRLPTGWTVRGSNPRGRRDVSHPSRLALRPTEPPVQWVPALSRGVRCGRDADPSLPSSTEVKNGVELYLYSP